MCVCPSPAISQKPVCVYVCVREIEREKENKMHEIVLWCEGGIVIVAKERERTDRQRQRDLLRSVQCVHMHLCACACVCVVCE